LVDKARKKGVADFKWVFKNEGIRYVLAGFAFAFSIQFHGLYGTTAFAWLFISALLILASRGWRNWSWFFVEFLIVVLGVVYVAYLTFESNSSAHINLGEWYRFINSLEYDDISLLFSLEYGGYGFLPLIFSGAYFAFKTKEKTDIEHLQLGLFYTFLIFIIIEVLHYNGAFFGKVSEYFIAAQLRRGVWIAVLVSLIILAKNYRIIQDGIHEKHRMLLVALGVTTFSAPSVGTVILFFSVAVFAAAQPKKRFVYFLLAVSIVGSLIHVCNRYVNIAIEVKSIILLITSVFVLYLLKRMNRDSIRSVVSSISSLVVIAFFCSGLYQEKFLKSFKKLHSIEKNDYSQFLSSFDKYYDPKTISCIKENTMDNDAINATQKIQLPLVGVRWYTESLYNQEFFISPRGIKGWQFSTFIYENSLKKIYLLFGKSAYNRIFDSLGKFPFAKENLDNRFMMEYETMSKDHLKSIRNKVGVRFYLEERKRNELSQALLCVGNLFHVYDLTKLG